MKSVFVAFDPPKPPTGGGTRTYHLLRAVSEISLCNLFVCFPVPLQELPADVAEWCATIQTSGVSFSQAKKGRLGAWYHQLRLLLFPFSISKERIVASADYYVQHPYNGSSQFKQIVYERLRLSLFKRAQKIYANGYTYPARTLERLAQYKELEAAIQASMATADLLWIDFSYPLPFFTWVKQTYPAVKLVCNAHNLEYRFLEHMATIAKDNFQREWLLQQSVLMKAAEIDGFKNCDLIAVCSDSDKKQLEELLPSAAIKVLPNGVDLSYFQPQKKTTSEPIILFTGTMNYTPNQDAVHYFIQSVLPLIRMKIYNCKFIVAGANASVVFPMYHNTGGVELVSSPPDMRPLYHKAMVVVVPLRSGSGTRLKILEAAAMKRPVISTSIGAEGLDLHHKKELLLADDNEYMANYIVHILSTPQAYSEMVDNAYLQVAAKYDWTVIRQQTGNLLKRLFFPV